MGEAAKCACPQSDARECYRWRNKLDMREHLGDHVDNDEYDAECCCGCHAEHELELEGEDWGGGDG